MKDTRKKATMQRVAETAGVSVSTVSRVINTPDFATQETRDRVMEVASSMGYKRPRSHAAFRPMVSMASGFGDRKSTGNIVLLAPEDLLGKLGSFQWIYRDVVPTLQRFAKRHGFNLVLSSYGIDDDWDPADIKTKHIDGVVWMAHDRGDLLDRISKVVPVVVLNDNSFWPPQTSVVASNLMVVYKAVEHLAELGHTHIGYFDTDDSSIQHCRERLAAYQQSIGHFNLSTSPDLCLTERFGVGEHPEAIARAMDRIESMSAPPTALIAPVGYAIQFLKEMRKRQLNVPEDMSIVAIDNAPEAEAVDPSLTAVDCVFGRCAEIAIKLLLESRGDPTDYVKAIQVEPQLIVRNSTARPKNTCEGEVN